MASKVKDVEETSLESNFYYPLSNYDLIDPVNYDIKTEVLLPLFSNAGNNRPRIGFGWVTNYSWS